MKTIDRLKQYLEYKGISHNAFNKSIGMSNAYIGKQIKNNASLGTDVVEKIVEVYTDLNLEWLITGKGPMLKEEKDGATSENINPMNTCALCEEKERLIQAKDQVISSLQAQIKLQAEQIEFLKNQLAAILAENQSKASSKKAS
ncbi:MAG: helix-turn-helix transcriptional regulator [Acidobacterium ailaaui]|nr:helix-turn-helix transcriptional regulator [Pseudacidobacterium ailaaui]